jgi:prepilin-type N-terminal cleavage/methylation domain-containing protein
MRITKNLKSGFTLVEIMIVVAIIGLLAAIAIPNFVKARETAQKNACINNLRQIDGAKQQWALETKAASDATPTEDNVREYLKNNLMPTCPVGDASYNIQDVVTVPDCPNASMGHTL